MKTDLHIDTAAVRAAAYRIDRQNEIIHQKFSEVHIKVTGLQASWTGEASEFMIRKYLEVKERCYLRRYLVMRNYAGILREKISEGYESTETGNRIIGQQFADSFR